VLGADGAPVAGATVRVHHADAAGLYNPPGVQASDARLNGAATTGADGAFRFETVRPAAYPDSSEPAHLHAEAGAPGFRGSYITLWFEGDPLLTETHRRHDARTPEIGIVTLARDADGTWGFVRDFLLAR